MRCALSKKRFMSAFDSAEAASYDATLTDLQQQSPEAQLFFNALNLDREEDLRSWSMEDLVTAFNAYPKYLDKLQIESEMLEQFSSMQARIGSMESEYKKRRIL